MIQLPLTLETDSQFGRKVWLICEVEEPQVLGLTCLAVCGGRETPPRTRIAVGREREREGGREREREREREGGR